MLPFTLGVFMVRHFEHSDVSQLHNSASSASTAVLDDTDVGRKAGLLAAAFSFAQVRSITLLPFPLFYACVPAGHSSYCSRSKNHSMRALLATHASKLCSL